MPIVALGVSFFNSFGVFLPRNLTRSTKERFVTLFFNFSVISPSPIITNIYSSRSGIVSIISSNPRPMFTEPWYKMIFFPLVSILNSFGLIVLIFGIFLITIAEIPYKF